MERLKNLLHVFVFATNNTMDAWQIKVFGFYIMIQILMGLLLMTNEIFLEIGAQVALSYLH